MKRFIACFTLVGCMYGQQKTPAESSTLNLSVHPAVIPAEIDPRDQVSSLDDLIRLADLIVEGTVIETLPAIEVPGKARTPLIETHSIISVSNIFRGTLPPGVQDISLVQLGGQYGEWNIVASQAPLVQVGEHYILFLNSDARPVPANTTGFPRFEVAGVWSGLVRVVGEARIQFSPAAMPKLHESDDNDLVSFTNQLRHRIRELWDNVIVINGPARRMGPGPQSEPSR